MNSLVQRAIGGRVSNNPKEFSEPLGGGPIEWEEVTGVHHRVNCKKAIFD